MDAKTAEVVQSLADKLGTTSEYLWSVMIKQAPIYAVTSVIEIAVIAVLVWLFIKSLLRMEALFDDTEMKTQDILYVAIGTFVLGVLSIAAFFTFAPIVTALLNPEYWALEKVLSSIKSK